MLDVRIHEAIGLTRDGDECRVILPPGLALVEIDPESPRQHALLAMEIFGAMYDHAGANIVGPWRAERAARAAGIAPAHPLVPAAPPIDPGA